MHRLFAVVLLIIPVLLSAQPAPDTLWTRTFGGTGNDVPSVIRQTSDGGYIIAGYTTSFGAADTDAYMLKLDSLGDLEWQWTLGNTARDVAKDVRQTLGGGYIVAGAFNDSLFLFKLTEEGDSVWERTYRFSRRQRAERITPCGEDYILTYKVDSIDYPYSGWQCYAAVDTTGDTLWTRCEYSFDVVWPVTYLLNWVDAEQGVGGSAFLSGQICRREYPEEQYGYYLQMYCLDQNGGLLWMRVIPSNYGQGGGLLLPLADGTCLIQLPGVGLVRINASGEQIGSISIGSRCADLCSLRTSDGSNSGLALLSTVVGAEDDVQLSAYNQSNQLLWQGTWGGAGNDSAVALEATSDSGYVIVGTTTSFGAGGTDIYVIKTDPHHWLNAEPKPTSVPSFFTLSTYPNPFNPSTTLTFSLTKQEKVELAVYDLEGRRVKVLADEAMQSGEHHITFDGAALPSGIYFARLCAGEKIVTKKMMLLK